MTSVGAAALITGAVAATTIAVDRVSKAVVERTLEDREPAHALGIPIRRHTNDRGISGTKQGGSANAALLVTGGALALGIASAGAYFGRGGGLAGTVLAVGTGLVAGGMAANLADRVAAREVTDFIPSPLGVLNLADLALGGGIPTALVGAALVALR